MRSHTRSYPFPCPKHNWRSKFNDISNLKKHEKSWNRDYNDIHNNAEE